MAPGRTSDLCSICLGLSHEQGRCLPIQGVCRIGIQQKLWEEGLEDVHKVCTPTAWIGIEVRNPGCYHFAEACWQGAPNIGLQVWLMTSRHTEPALHMMCMFSQA